MTRQTWDGISHMISAWVIGDPALFPQAVAIARTQPSAALKEFLVPAIKAGETPEAVAVREQLGGIHDHGNNLNRIVWSHVAVDLVMEG